MISFIIAIALAVSAVQAEDIKSKVFIKGMDRAGQPVITRYFIGLEWPCSAGGGRLRKSTQTCYAGLEYNFDDAAGLVTGP